MTRELTGRHVLIIAISAFAIVIAANLAMLFAATGSFPGLVVKNSYVAGVGWDERATAQQTLGWTPEITYAGRELAVILRDPAGGAVADVALKATVGRPSTDAEDREVALVRRGDGFVADVALAPGTWRIDLATTGGASWRVTAGLYVPEAR